MISDAKLKRHPREGSLLGDSAAALVSSSIFSTAFYPLHRVKILLQTQDSNPLVVNGQVPRYRVLDTIPRLLREGGMRELWRGNVAYMMRHVPSTTLSFAFKDAALRHMPHYSGPGELGKAAAINLAAGFLGGAAALLLVYPLDFATIRMASELHHQKRSQGVMATLNSTQRSGGVAALYRGYGVSAAAIGAYKALYFGLYDTACAAMEQHYARSDATVGPNNATPSVAPSSTRSTESEGGASAQLAGPSLLASASSETAPEPEPTTPRTAHRHLAGVALPSGPPQRLGLMERWAAANLVVITASSLTYPLDVVRKRLVADTAMGPERQQYRGFVDCVAKIARTEGFRGFYRFYGYDMLLRLGGGVLLVLYDEIKAHGPSATARQLMLSLPHSVATAAGVTQPPGHMKWQQHSHQQQPHTVAVQDTG